MGCGASAAIPPGVAAHTSGWTVLRVRIRWSGFDDQSPTLTLTVFDERGNPLLKLLGGAKSGTFTLPQPRRATFSPYYSDTRTVGTGKKKRHNVWLIADASGNELYHRVRAGRWTRVGGGQAAVDVLPAGLSVQNSRGVVQVFTDDARAISDDEDPARGFAIQQPDGSTVFAQPEASELDNLIATIAKRGERPRNDAGGADMCGDMVYAMTVKPKLLASTDVSTLKLLLAMCVDPFWTQADLSVGYSPARTNHG